jgi:hypothetical protein
VRRRTGIATFVPVRALPTRRRAVGTFGAALLLVTAAACSSGSDDTTVASAPSADETIAAPTDPSAADDANGAESGPAVSSTPDPGDNAPAVVVPAALQFSAPLVGGGTFDGAASAGKPTVFWFWAPT